MKKISCFFLFTIMQVYAVNCIAQKELTVGDACPDFTINNIINYSNTSVKISDFRGKLLLLDFWATWCSPCIASFPDIEALQKKYVKDMQVLPVTFEDKKTVVAFLQNMQKIKGLTPPPTVVDDSVLNTAFKHAYIPHYVWINKQGAICAITGLDDVTDKNIQIALAGETLHLPLKKEEKQALDPMLPAFSGKQQVEIQSTDLLYQSTLLKYNDKFFSYSSVDSNRITGMNLSIEQLFRLAYGELKPEFITESTTILNTEDTATPNNYTFGNSTDEKQFDKWKWQHLFCYELVVPPMLQKEKFDIMQHELERYFDLTGKIEKRQVKCYVLIRTSKEDKLKSAGGAIAWDHNRYYMHIANQPLKAFLAAIVLDMQTQLPLIDETGYEGNIELEFNANMSDVNSVNEALKKYDLQFIEAERPVNFIILRQKE